MQMPTPEELAAALPPETLEAIAEKEAAEEATNAQEPAPVPAPVPVFNFSKSPHIRSQEDWDLYVGFFTGEHDVLSDEDICQLIEDFAFAQQIISNLEQAVNSLTNLVRQFSSAVAQEVEAAVTIEEVPQQSAADPHQQI